MNQNRHVITQVYSKGSGTYEFLVYYKGNEVDYRSCATVETAKQILEALTKDYPNHILKNFIND